MEAVAGGEGAGGTRHGILQRYGVDDAQLDSVLHSATTHLPPGRTHGRRIVLTAAGYSHAHLLLNWIVALRRNIDESMPFAVICLDAPLRHFLANLGVKCYHSMLAVPEQYDAFTGVGYMKATVVAAVVERGWDVLLMDTDAVVSGNHSFLDIVDHASRAAEMNGNDGSLAVDIVGSQSGMPNEALQAWGFALNLGWVFFRGGSAAAVCALARMLEHMETFREHGINPNDQVSFNSVLLESQVVWFRTQRLIQEQEQQRPTRRRRERGSDRSSRSNPVNHRVELEVGVVQGKGPDEDDGLRGAVVVMVDPKSVLRVDCSNAGALESRDRLATHNIHCNARNDNKVFALRRAGVW